MYIIAFMIIDNIIATTTFSIPKEPHLNLYSYITLELHNIRVSSVQANQNCI